MQQILIAPAGGNVRFPVPDDGTAPDVLRAGEGGKIVGDVGSKLGVAR